MKRSRFQAPRVVSDFETVQRALREVQEALDAATMSRAQLKVNTQDFGLVAGAFHRASAGVGGLKARLPAAGPENLSDPIFMHLENMQGELTIFAPPGQSVNGADTATFDIDGVVVLYSNGVDSWSGFAQVPTNSPASPTALGWDDVLLVDAHSGASNPTIDAGQSVVFAGGGGAGGDIKSTGSLEVVTVGDMHLHASGAVHVGHTGSTDLIHLEADGEIAGVAGAGVSFIAGTDVDFDAAGTISFSTGAAVRFIIEVDGSWQIAGSNGTAGQYLRSAGASSSPLWASISFGDMPTLDGLSVLGRAANSTGVMAAITAATARHVLRANDALTSLEWGYPIAIAANSGAFTDAFSINAIAGTHTTAAFTPSVAGNSLLAYSVDLSTLVPAIDSTSVVASGTTLQRAALTGFAVASQNSNATTSAEPIVTYSTSSNMSAERVTTTSSTVTVDVGTAGQIKFNVDQSAAYSWTGNHIFDAGVRGINARTLSSVSASIDNQSVTGSTYLRITLASPQNLTGMVGDGEGHWIFIANEDTIDALTIVHDATSTAANRFLCPGNQDLTLLAGCGVWARYSGGASGRSRWIIAHGGRSVQANNTLLINAAGAGKAPIETVVETDQGIANIGEGSSSTGLIPQSRDDLMRWLESSPMVTTFEQEFQGNLAANGSALFTSLSSLTGTSVVAVTLDAGSVSQEYLGALNIEHGLSSFGGGSVASSAWVLGANESARNFNWGSFRYMCVVLRLNTGSTTARTHFAIGLVGPFNTYSAITVAGLLGGTSEGIFWSYDTGASSGQWVAGLRSGSATNSTASAVTATSGNRYVLEIFKTTAGTLYYYINGTLVRTDATNAIAAAVCNLYSIASVTTNTGARNYGIDYIKIVSQPPNNRWT